MSGTVGPRSPRDPGSVASHDWEQWTSPARLVVTDADRLDEAVATAGAVLADIDRAASRFRPDSELVTLRRDADGGVQLSEVLTDLVAEALLAAELSAGAVDPTVGSALAEIGYDRDIRLVVSDRTPLRAVVRRVPGWRTLRLEGNRLFRPEGVRLDLGATAKAVAADRIAALVHDRLGTGVLISLGGDIATAGPTPAGGWQVSVQDTPQEPEARIALAPGTAIATSSTVRRTWRRGGVTYHHIVDPSTSQPAARHLGSVSVVAATCAEANTISTATLVKNADGAAWVAATGRAARLVDLDGRVQVLNGWPEERAA
jgi:thiamine biosynthesis lipoprotein